MRFVYFGFVFFLRPFRWGFLTPWVWAAVFAMQATVASPPSPWVLQPTSPPARPGAAAPGSERLFHKCHFLDLSGSRLRGEECMLSGADP